MARKPEQRQVLKQRESSPRSAVKKPVLVNALEPAGMKQAAVEMRSDSTRSWQSLPKEGLLLHSQAEQIPRSEFRSCRRNPLTV